MWVTLYTDASWHPGRREGGWAVWARSELGRIVRSGACPSYTQSAAHAELAAVYAGIFLVVKKWGEQVEGIQVRSDNQQALEAVQRGAAPAKDPVMRHLQQMIEELVRGRVYLRPRWVKGHRNPNGDVTAWLNAHCDREAKRARQRAESAPEPSPAPQASVAPQPAGPQPGRPRRRRWKRRRAPPGHASSGA